MGFKNEDGIIDNSTMTLPESSEKQKMAQT